MPVVLPVLFSEAGCFFYHADVCDLPAPSVPLDMVIDNTVFQNVFRTGDDHSGGKRDDPIFRYLGIR